MSMEDKFAALISRLEAVTTKLESGGGGGGGAAPAPPAAPADDGVVAPSVAAFDDFISGEVAAFVAAAEAIGDAQVTDQAKKLMKAFTAQREMLSVVSKAKKPSDGDFQSKCVPATSEALGEVQAAVDRKSKLFNNLQAVGEAVPALGWVCVPKTPGPHVADMWASGEYYYMKILKDFKGKDDKQMKYAACMKEIFVKLQAYIKEHHRTGLEWNPKGVDLAEALKAGAGAPPPPPATGGAAAAKPPKFGLNGKKWEVEHQVKNSSLVIEGCDVKQSAYIYKCTDCVIRVNDKINSIALDGCKKVALVFDTVVAGVELVDCDSCKVQVMGKVQTVSIDKCMGIQVILNKDCFDAEILTAKCSELNLLVPGKGEDDDWKEFPVPEQFISKWNADKYCYDTVCMAHSG